MSEYLHTQRGTQMLIAMALALVVLVAIAAYGIALAIGGVNAAWTMALPVVVTVPILVGVGLMFSSMTVRIADGRLEWWFGKGFPRYSKALSDIESVAVWPSRGFALGIHWTRDGWLYNVSGMKGVHVSMRDGSRFIVGSDEPEALYSALNAALQTPVISSR